jgi:hypothetical protein
VSVDSKVTEQNSTWWRFAWKLTVRNDSRAQATFRGTIEFQDKDGFVNRQFPTDVFVVGAGAEDTATGFALVRVPGAANVASTLAKVGLAR